MHETEPKASRSETGAERPRVFAPTPRKNLVNYRRAAASLNLEIREWSTESLDDYTAYHKAKQAYEAEQNKTRLGGGDSTDAAFYDGVPRVQFERSYALLEIIGATSIGQIIGEITRLSQDEA